MASGPLTGIRVLEFSQIVAAPVGGINLSDLGADVIKVEPPEGEQTRRMGAVVTYESKAYQGLNRGKRSLAVNLKETRGREIILRLVRGDDGAVITFEGVVRNNTKGRRTLYLDYECYEPMAVKVMAEIGRQIAGAYPIDRIAMVHRLGRMEISEASVAIIVTAAHRKAAFEAALEGINRLKRLVPIWKKEHFADGEVWVEGEWDCNAPSAAGL